MSEASEALANYQADVDDLLANLGERVRQLESERLQVPLYHTDLRTQAVKDREMIADLADRVTDVEKWIGKHFPASPPEWQGAFVPSICDKDEAAEHPLGIVRRNIEDYLNWVESKINSQPYADMSDETLVKTYINQLRCGK